MPCAKTAVVIGDSFETDAQKQMMQVLLDGFIASQDQFTATHVYVPFSDYEPLAHQSGSGSSTQDSPVFRGKINTKFQHLHTLCLKKCFQ